jgi:hypothetical protein
VLTSFKGLRGPNSQRIRCLCLEAPRRSAFLIRQIDCAAVGEVGGSTVDKIYPNLNLGYSLNHGFFCTEALCGQLLPNIGVAAFTNITIYFSDRVSIP